MNRSFRGPAAFLLLLFVSLLGHAQGTLTGTVTDAGSGEPLPFAAVVLEHSAYGAVTDAEGRYAIGGVAAGTYTLVVRFVGYADHRALVHVADGATVRTDVALSGAVEVLEEIALEMPRTQRRADRARKLEAVPQANGAALSMPVLSVADDEGLPYGPPVSPGAAGDPLDHDTEAYDRIFENPFRAVVGNPLSTFSIDVDAASYANVRRYVDYGQRPPADAVRIEELVNYFSYDYPQPEDGLPFRLVTELGENPWNDTTRLVHIGLQGLEVDLEELGPSNLVFLIDVSGSMNAANKLGLVKSALHALTDQLGERDRIALVVYAGAAGLVLPSTPGHRKDDIHRAIDALQAGGSTAGGAGIRLAYDVAQRHFLSEGNNRVILCTDGDFNVGASSDAEMTRLIEEKRETGVYITVCGFGMGNYKDSKMEKIADHGNGNYFYIDREQEAHKVFVTDMRATLFTIAQDVKLQVEFNPAMVRSYRLIGYENRMLAKEDFDDDTKDAGELGVGHTVTALYEVVLTREALSREGGDQARERVRQGGPGETLRYQESRVKPGAYRTDELLHLKLRYKEPGGQASRLIEHPLALAYRPLEATSDNYRWAAAVAAYGLVLRDSEYRGAADLALVEDLARGARGGDALGYRADFLRLVGQTKGLLTASR
jgi:Ca-activated chloride channel family protein